MKYKKTQTDNSMKSGISSREIETIKKKSEILEMKNTIEEIKINLEALSITADNMEERISNIEDSNVEMLQMEEERELRLKRN